MRSCSRAPSLRRTFLAALLGTGLVAALGGVAPAQAQNFPVRPVHIVVPYPPGGAVDQVARLIAPKLEADLGQPVVVENKAGAGGLLGSDGVARAPADGHTLVFATVSSHAIAPAVYAKMPYDPIADFAMVSNVALTPYIITVNPTVPAKTLKALVDYAKANGNALNFGSSGKGTTPHLAGELFNTVAGTRITHVPYKGSAPMVADLLANHVQVAFDNTVIPHIQAGRLVGLAVTGPRRLSSVPDIPTAAEAGLPGYEAVGWMGLMGPRGTPPDVVARLSRATVQALAAPDVRAKLDALGFQGDGGTPQAFEAFVRAERSKWSKVVRDAGIQPE